MALERASSDQIPNLGFWFGRIDCPLSPDGDEGDFSFPDPETGFENNYEWFEQQFNFTERETVAIIGAHTLGRVHSQFSGFGTGLPLFAFT